MLNREFEKQVQDKMGELNFTPSAPVWTNIEKVIRKKKERRRILFWIPLLAAGIFGAIWWNLPQKDTAPSIAESNGKEASVPQPESSPQQDPSQRTSGQNTTTVPGTENADNEESSSNRQTTSETSVNKKTLIERTTNFDPSGPLNDFSLQNKRVKEKTVTAHASLKQKNISAADPSPDDRLTSTGMDQPLEKNSIRQKDNRGKPLKKVISPLPGPGPYGNKSILDSAAKRKDDKKPDTSRTLNAVVHAETHVTADETIKDDVTSSVPEEARKSDSASAVTAIALPEEEGWTFQVVVSSGIARSGKALSFAPTSSIDRFYASPNSGSLGAVYNMPPSPVYSGLAFSAGILAQKKINEELSFTTGLEYRYYSTGVDIGLRLAGDTLVNYQNQRVKEFYTKNAYSEGIGRYNNAYYFISLPVALDIKLSHKVPISLHTGFSIQRLIATDGLLFSNSAQVYYEDPNAMNKTQLFSRLGLYYTFSLGKNTPVLIGPELTYGMKRLQKVSTEEKLFSAGISTRIGLNKKFF